MRVALAGKGGAGKTTLSATLARMEARRGTRVIAVDADSNPNLAPALGISPGSIATDPPASLVSRRADGPALAAPLDEVVRAHGTSGPDGISLVRMGAPDHADAGCLCGAHALVSALLSDLGSWEEVLTIIDLEASPEHLSRGTARHADLMLLVAEPYFRSLEAVRRLASLAAELPIARVSVVGNKIRSQEEAEAVAAFCDRHGLSYLGEVPWDDAVTEADRKAVPLIDAVPGSPAVAAAARIAEHLHAAAPSA